MTRTRRLAILAAVCVAATVTPGVLFFRMRAAVPAPSRQRGSVKPVLAIPRTRFGGAVREVLAKAGDRVEAGQVLVRFEAREVEDRLLGLRKAARAAETALKSGDALAKIPGQVRQYLYEMHPDTVRAEREYVDALAAFEHAREADREPASARLRHAAAERVRVRLKLGQLFSGANGEDWHPALAQIAANIGELEKLLQDAEVRAPARAWVDILDAQPGDKFQPGQPVAILIAEGEYSTDLRVSPSALARLHTGMVLNGRLDNGQRIEARIESIAMRKLPVIARENLQVAEEPAVRARVVSAAPLRVGAAATFELP